jgi:NosR/NirI family transcriptional regulator, nitrous oxide reductase regulator
MSQRPIHARRLNRRRPWVLHLFRAAVLTAIVWLVHQQHVWYQAQVQGRQLAAIRVDQVRRFYPQAAELSQWNPQHGGQTVLDVDGRPVGYVVQTSPASDAIIGYSGPTNTLIALDTQHRILGLEILRCGDTPEHLQAVLADRRFLRSFDGLSWQEAAARGKVDGVSGATLTSLAIVEGIVRRLGGAPHSYRFPDPMTVAEVRPFLPQAARLTAWDQKPALRRVEDASGQLLGFAGRTSPAADDLIGFQGPTDTLFVMDTQQRVLGIAMRRSYDTTEYLPWVTDDKHFMSRFNGTSLDELADLDPVAAGIEGVSGATMTSMSMAHALARAAQAARDARPAAAPPSWTINARDWGTAAVVLGGLLLAFARGRGQPWIRVGFQLLLIGYLGFINGDMVSQALLVGWAQNGVAWRLAPGLVLLVAAAFLTPLLTRRQVYCHQLCPHGAAQQLIKNAVPRRWRPASGLPQGISRCLGLLPFLLLAWVVIVAMQHRTFNLAAIEPFDAYVVQVAGWATLAVAVGGLVVSLFVPMAYCRFGCPTGAVLNYVRLQGPGDRFGRRDIAALALLALAIGLRLAAVA